MLKRTSKRFGGDDSSDKEASPRASDKTAKSPRGSLRSSEKAKSPRGSLRSSQRSPRSPRSSGLLSPRGSGLLSPRGKSALDKTVLTEMVKEVVADETKSALQEARLMREGQAVDVALGASSDIGIFFYKHTSAGIRDVFDVVLHIAFDVVLSYCVESVSAEDARVLITHSQGKKAKEVTQIALDSVANAEEMICLLDAAMLKWMHQGNAVDDAFDTLLLPGKSPVSERLAGFLLVADTRNSDFAAGVSKDATQIKGKRFPGAWVIKVSGAVSSSERQSPAIIIPTGIGICLLLAVPKVMLTWYWKDVPSFGSTNSLLVIKHGKEDLYSLKSSVSPSELNSEFLAALKNCRDPAHSKPLPIVYPPLDILRNRTGSSLVKDAGDAIVKEEGNGDASDPAAVLVDVKEEKKERTRGQLVVNGQVVKRNNKKQGNMIDNLGLETDEMKQEVLRDRLE